MSPAHSRMRVSARATAAAGAVSGAVCVVGVHQAAFCSPLEQGQPSASLRDFVSSATAASRIDSHAAPQQGSHRGSLAAGALFATAAAAARPRRGARRSHIARASQEAPELKSERDVDYSKLSELLTSSDFRGADEETRRLLVQLAGAAALKRGWVYFTEVRTMPEADLQTIDSLWQHHSKGKFGWAPQRKIWRQCREQFDKFALEVSWFTDKWQNRNWPDEFIYSADAPAGHLPLTNCIRGAQVLQELLAHPAFEKKKVASSAPAAGAAEGSGKKSALSMLALGRAGPARPAPPAAFAGAYAPSSRSAAVACAAEVAEPEVAPTMELSAIKFKTVINENGFVLPEIPKGTEASAFMIFDSQNKPQYLGFSKDLRNTLRTLLCRRPELCYKYKCDHLLVSDNQELLALRKAWINDLGLTPPGNKDPRQKSLWENPVDGGAITERAYRIVAEQKAKQITQQLRDRGLKEQIEFKEDLIDEGKVDIVPSQMDLGELAEISSALSGRTSHVEKEVGGKLFTFEVFYQNEFQTTGGGWWFDVEVSADQTKSVHRVIVGKEMMHAVGATDPKQVVENAFATLLFKRLPRNTSGIITSEVFPVNYFTAANVAENFPEFLGLFDKTQEEFDYNRNQWNFRQIHDYSQDEKRTIPAGPNGGLFDPAALM